MKVQAAQKSIYTYTGINNKKQTPANSNSKSCSLAPKGLRAVHFGCNIKPANIEGLLKDYRWFIQHDKLPAINSLLKLETGKEAFDTLVRTILKNDELSYELIDSIIKQPRNMKYFLKGFEEKLPYGSDIFLSFIPNNIYKQAYTKYIDKRFENTKSISELLEIRPDWKEEVLLAKHREIYHNNDFELGHVPEEINHEKFEGIVKYLHNFMDINLNKKDKHIPPLTLDGKTFNFKYFTDGKTDKNVFGISGENGERFIIKIAPTERTSLDDACALGTLCKIDTYLTRNYCRNSAPLKYYNHNLNASIYDFIEHQKVNKKITLDEIRGNIPDFVDLNMKYNDTTGHNNFFILDDTQHRIKGMNDYHYGVNKSEWITVDNDHVVFESRFQPIIDKYHHILPNTMDVFCKFL